MDNYVENDEDTPWECHLCGRDDDFDIAPYGWIGDIHPLCKHCADTLLHDHDHEKYGTLSYHYKVGDIPVSAKGFKIKHPPVLDFEKIMESIGFEWDWVTIL